MAAIAPGLSPALKIATATRTRVAATAGIGGGGLGYTSATLQRITGGGGMLKTAALVAGAGAVALIATDTDPTEVFD